MNDDLKVLFHLKRDRADAQGHCPVLGRITVGRTMAQFGAKCTVDPAIWDSRSGRAKGKSAHAADVNGKLGRISLSINAHYMEMLAKKASVTAREVKNAFQGIASEQTTLVQYFSDFIGSYEKRVGIDRSKSALYNYRKALDHLTAFLKVRYQ